MTQPGDQPNPWSREGQWAGQPAETPPPFYPPAPLPEPKSPPPFYPQPPSSPPPYPQQPPTPYPPAPERPRRTGRWVALGVVGAVLTGLAMWAVIADDRAHPAGSSSGSTSSAASVGDTKVVTASDKRSQLTVPTSWADAPASFKNEHASLQLGDARGERYVLIVSASSVDFDNFAGFSEACVQEAREILEGAEIGEARPLTIGGLNAVQHAITGKASGFKIAFWYTMIEGKRGYYQVVGWTLPSRKAEAEPAILKVIDSFRELGAG